MTDHDPLCPCYGLNYLDAPPGYKMPDCYCDLIAAVGERIAQAIEAVNLQSIVTTIYWLIWDHVRYVAVRDAARIARNGGVHDR